MQAISRHNAYVCIQTNKPIKFFTLRIFGLHYLHVLLIVDDSAMKCWHGCNNLKETKAGELFLQFKDRYTSSLFLSIILLLQHSEIRFSLPFDCLIIFFRIL